jgi:hypothetical protein
MLHHGNIGIIVIVVATGTAVVDTKVGRGGVGGLGVGIMSSFHHVLDRRVTTLVGREKSWW